MKYQLIYADPPWSYRNKKTGGSHTSGSEDQYPTLTVDEIAALDVPSICERDAVLFLWATVPMLPEAFEVMKAWGFNYKTLHVWAKLGRMGLGYWFRGNVEILLFGTKGKVPAFRLLIKNIHAEKPTKHSAKPRHFREVCEATKLTPRIELFARERVEGWHSWGLDVESDVVVGSR